MNELTNVTSDPVSRRRILMGGSTAGLAGLAITVASPALAGPGTDTQPSPVALGPGGAVRPETFGAVPDGRTDCTAAIKAAIRAATQPRVVAGRQRNLPVVLSAGAYLIRETITIAVRDFSMIGPGGQNCVLLFDHLAGDALLYTGGGDSQFTGFGIDATELRKAAGSGRGFTSIPARAANESRSSTLRLTLSDFHVLGQPGDGIAIFNCEGLRLENITTRLNRGDGCFIDCSEFENILNQLDFCRFRDNQGHGLRVVNVASSMFSRVECLNNLGPAQFSLSGRANQVHFPDCECYDIMDGQTARIGLVISGRGNTVQGGAFYKLTTAIALRGASHCRIILPVLEGARRMPMRVGIDIAADCKQNLVDVLRGNFVRSWVNDAGSANRVLIDGVQSAAGSAAPGSPTLR
jgi:hypothetical protein